ncbi:MAG: hypothetical protein AAB217_27245 [Chloroflexota bacterium]
MNRQITMNNGMDVARQAAADIEAWLKKYRGTIGVVNVENNHDFQKADIDLIWVSRRGTDTIEIKADRWQDTGNFFFETESNKEKGTPGCFLYTEANYIFYYFVKPRLLYILPMPQTREWFLANKDRFEERETTTPVGDGHYTTVGRLVPIETVVSEVPEVKQKKI